MTTFYVLVVVAMLNLDIDANAILYTMTKSECEGMISITKIQIAENPVLSKDIKFNVVCVPIQVESRD